ncbi:hypothetical protein [Haladaptatus sp. DYSN1]|uniref:hypothetical protein n=1 Tax=unclassified Haladaptatus TaxID=2622732 RepID=UPI0024053C58|nr:hypothetical protein [Haladaptatus sp. DYSN1]
MDDSVQLGPPLVTCQPFASLEGGRFKVATFSPIWFELDQRDTRKLYDALSRLYDGHGGVTFPVTNRLAPSTVPRNLLVDVESRTVAFFADHTEVISFDARDTRKIFDLLDRNLRP